MPAYAKVIERLGVVPEPVYGTQLQDMAVPGVAPEGKVRVELHASAVASRTAPGRVAQTQLQITQLGYGPMHPDTASRPASPRR
jgi:CxxC motif-containing protein (DUF1111 family)